MPAPRSSAQRHGVQEHAEHPLAIVRLGPAAGHVAGDDVVAAARAAPSIAQPAPPAARSSAAPSARAERRRPSRAHGRLDPDGGDSSARGSPAAFPWRAGEALGRARPPRRRQKARDCRRTHRLALQRHEVAEARRRGAAPVGSSAPSRAPHRARRISVVRDADAPSVQRRRGARSAIRRNVSSAEQVDAEAHQRGLRPSRSRAPSPRLIQSARPAGVLRARRSGTSSGI